MTTIFLIRHGQASYGSRNYDQLSPLGHRQAQITGAYLAHETNGVVQVISGAMRRQVETAHQVAQFHPSAVLNAPEKAFDEYDMFGILQAYRPILEIENSRLAEFKSELHEDRRLYMDTMVGAIEMWAEGVDAPVSERWEEFRDRVVAGLDVLAGSFGQQENIVLCTSAGVIATILGDVLELPARKALMFNWHLRNASISGIKVGRRGRSVALFNSVAHLASVNPAMVTYW